MVRICVNRRMKQTTEITQISADFFCVLCKFLCLLWFFSSIGVNLCKSVDDKDAKGAKDTKDAKKKFFCALCKFLCLLWFFLQSA